MQVWSSFPPATRALLSARLAPGAGQEQRALGSDHAETQIVRQDADARDAIERAGTPPSFKIGDPQCNLATLAESSMLPSDLLGMYWQACKATAAAVTATGSRTATIASMIGVGASVLASSASPAGTAPVGSDSAAAAPHRQLDPLPALTSPLASARTTMKRHQRGVNSWFSSDGRLCSQDIVFESPEADGLPHDEAAPSVASDPSSAPVTPSFFTQHFDVQSLRILGSGATGTVYAARHRLDSTVYALKTIGLRQVHSVPARAGAADVSTSIVPPSVRLFASLHRATEH